MTKFIVIGLYSMAVLSFVASLVLLITTEVNTSSDENEVNIPAADYPATKEFWILLAIFQLLLLAVVGIIIKLVYFPNYSGCKRSMESIGVLRILVKRGLELLFVENEQSYYG